MRKLIYILMAMLVACSVECLGAPPTKQAEIIRTQGKRKDGNRPRGKGKATRGGGSSSRDNSPSLAQGIKYYENDEYDKAIPILLRYAKQGNSDAQLYLGECYRYGAGSVAQDYTQSVKWLRKAAEQGNVEAQFLMGESYYFGEGVCKDYSEAKKWYRAAAEQGDTSAEVYVNRLEAMGY